MDPLKIDTVRLSEAGDALVIIDQTLLPNEVRYLRLRETEDICEAIRMLRVRGAPAIGVAAAFGAYLAAHYGIPFYVCAPSSTIDPAIASGAEIPIEFRDGSEVTELWYAKRMAPEGVGVYNPAFDVTEAGLITGIITERGMVRAPFEAGFRELGLLG